MATIAPAQVGTVSVMVLDGTNRWPLTDGSLFGGEPQRVEVADGNLAYALAVAADRLPVYAALNGPDAYPVTLQVSRKNTYGWDFIDAYDMGFQGDIEDLVTLAGGPRLATSSLGSNGLYHLRQAWKAALPGKSFSRR